MQTGLARMRILGRRTVLVLALAGSSLTVLPSVAQAQDSEARLRKIETEIRALQRTVFPGGDGRFFTPEVLTPGQAAAGASGTSATTAVTDILGRLDSMEGQLQRLTSQTEENTNAIAQIAARLDAIEAGGRMQAVETPVAATIPVAVVPAPTPAPTPALAPVRTPPINQAPATVPVPAPAPAPALPSPARVAAVKAVVKPSTADIGDDEYTYGFRLWDAKFFPEAQQQLRLFVEKYPKHYRATYARNLLGRAYLDDGKPREAAPWFLENYQADKAGERAPDSLLFLAETMITIGDTNRACLALAEFGEVYPAIASGRLLTQYKADTAKIRCP